MLVQSPGMAQWLQMEIAKKRGVAANFQFPMPSSFIWKLYADNLPNVSTQNPLKRFNVMAINAINPYFFTAKRI